MNSNFFFWGLLCFSRNLSIWRKIYISSILLHLIWLKSNDELSFRLFRYLGILWKAINQIWISLNFSLLFASFSWSQLTSALRSTVQFRKRSADKTRAVSPAIQYLWWKVDCQYLFGSLSFGHWLRLHFILPQFQKERIGHKSMFLVDVVY